MDGMMGPGMMIVWTVAGLLLVVLLVIVIVRLLKK